ncbi:soluble component of the flagellar export system [Buchnera aphidicola (Cinara tujafilina)]|uniref:Flagellar FliJ protein n=1 Tax=Buchnera aphidicola (Cinara tujafilina) TaxID=261317 RepID=F7WYY9_9GAMM|nr:flagellar FliJ family protein [Buchnera aphidicola]AEH39639.1 soluble component of the flagellar export system [Buchnera aphidicola (Cinara tujafilina)]
MYIIKDYVDKKKIFNQILQLKKYYDEYYNNLYKSLIHKGIIQYQVKVYRKFLYMLQTVILKQQQYIAYYNKQLSITRNLHKNMYMYFKKLCILESHIYQNIRRIMILKEQRISDILIESFSYIKKILNK